MTIGILATVRNARLNALRDAIDQGAGPAQMKFYTAPRPATCAAPSGATLLAQLALSDPSAPNAAAGVLTFSAVGSDVSADATGTCTWCRIEDSNGVAIIDLGVTTTGGGGDVTINNANIQIGTIVAVTSATLTDGNA